MNEWWTDFIAWLPEWVPAIFLVIAVVFVTRLVFGTLGVRSKLDNINDRILFAADAIVDSLRPELSELRREVSSIREEIAELRSGVSSMRYS